MQPAPPTEAAPRPKPGAEIEVRIDDLDPSGGVRGHAGVERVWLARGRPGALVVARVLRRRRTHVEAQVLSELEAGAGAVDPRCLHAADCGGCSFQHIGYARQLELLRDSTCEALEPLRTLGLEPREWLTHVEGARDPWAYRNKMDFTFSNRRWVLAGEPAAADASFALGLHIAGRHQKVLDITRCEIQFDEGNAILVSARRLAREQGLAPWDLRDHSGVLRHLVLRKACATGQILVVLVTAPGAEREVETWARALVAAHAEITSLVHAVSSSKATVALGEVEHVLHGPGWIEERLAGIRFRVSPRSFFQVNTAQAERLVELVRAAAGPTAGRCVYDVCCGAGTLGLATATDARELWGFELESAAVDDARVNAAENRIEPARYVAGDVLKTLRADALAALGAARPDVALVDPPRAGLHTDVVAALLALAPERLVYVSCNARAAARDLPLLVAGGYAITSGRALDMFPHTPHLECVWGLERRAAALPPTTSEAVQAATVAPAVARALPPTTSEAGVA
jgi:23S rRNA (uracil1939-C5)-methyltransferase